MIYSPINNTDLKVSVICLGTWVFGGDSWGGSNEKDCANAVSCAADFGINFIDTAPIYGWGKSEAIVGKATKGKRKRFVIATKCGFVNRFGKATNNLTPASIKKEVEKSLRHLQTDYIDLYQCHWPDAKTPIEATMQTMNQLKKEGKIRYIGVSNFEPDLVSRACPIAEVVTSQNGYSMLDRSIEKKLLPLLQQRSIGLLAYGPLGGGILTGKYKSPPTLPSNDARKFFYEYYDGEAFERAQALLDTLKGIGKPLNQVAINWVRQQPDVASVIVGCRNAQQVKDNVAAVLWDLSAQQLEGINEKN